jgi:hypothetical protein
VSLNIELCPKDVSFLLSYKYSREIDISTNLFFSINKKVMTEIKPVCRLRQANAEGSCF